MEARSLPLDSAWRQDSHTCAFRRRSHTITWSLTGLLRSSMKCIRPSACVSFTMAAT
jgi:hypothetical protein